MTDLQADAHRRREQGEEDHLEHRLGLREEPALLLLHPLVVTDGRVRKAGDERRLVAQHPAVGGVVVELLLTQRDQPLPHAVGQSLLLNLEHRHVVVEQRAWYTVD
eukprot:scaffold15503_cov60-Phaeocystis_antarctica.AAC.4